MSVDQERISDVPRNDRGFVDVELIKRLDKVDASTSRGVGRFDDPDVAFGLCLAQFLVVSMEVMELVWKDVSVRDEVKLVSSESFLHLYVVVAKSIFSGDFVALREVVYSLVFVQTFVQVAFAAAC